MAGKRTPQTGATPPARVYDPAAVASLEPPVQRKPRESSIPQEVISAMAGIIANGGWAGNGMAYGEKEEAQAEAGKFKRVLGNAQIDGVRTEKDLRTRTWETADGHVFAVTRRQPKES